MAAKKKPPTRRESPRRGKQPRAVGKGANLAAAVQKQYQPLHDKARHYKNKRTGKIISKRQYDKLRRGGITSEKYRVYRAAKGIDSHLGLYNKIVEDYKKKHPNEKVRGNKKFKEMIKDLKYKGKDKKKLSKKFNALLTLDRVTPERRNEYLTKWRG